MDLRLEYCDTAIFLDFPHQLCTWRVFKRFLMYRGGKGRPDMAAGCTEKINVGFLKWTWTYPTRSRVGVVRRLERVCEQISIARLTTNREVENFLLSCGSRTESENGNRELRDQYR